MIFTFLTRSGKLSWQEWLIPIADERVVVQIKLLDSLRTREPERFWGGVSRRGAISSVRRTFIFTFVSDVREGGRSMLAGKLGKEYVLPGVFLFVCLLGEILKNFDEF